MPNDAIDLARGARTIRVCYPFVGDSVGGAQISTLSLIRALPPWIEPVVVVHREGSLSRLLTEEGISFRQIALSDFVGRQPSPWHQLRAITEVTGTLWRFLKQNSIDIVHTQDGRMHATWWLAAKLAAVPQIWHQRSMFVDSRLLQFMVRHVAAVVANSKVALASLPRGTAERTRIIFNPVEGPSPELQSQRAAIIRQAEEIGGKLAPDTIILAAVGNLRAVKQPQLLADAVAAGAASKSRPLLLALFGDDTEGWVPRMSATIKSAGGRARLVHFGFRHPIQPWLKGCDLLVAASSGDTFGRTLVEAMSVGIPVIAVDAGGHREIITDGQNGLLVADGDAEALAKTLGRAIDDHALALRLAGAGRNRARDFESGRHAGQISEVYRNVLASQS